MSKRIYEGFEAIALAVENAGGGNAIVVSHGMTIGTFMWLIDPDREKQYIDNGSVTVVEYENGQFTIKTIGDMSYRYRGREIIESIRDEE